MGLFKHGVYTEECSNSNAQHVQDEPFVQMCIVPIFRYQTLCYPSLGFQESWKLPITRTSADLHMFNVPQLPHC